MIIERRQRPRPDLTQEIPLMKLLLTNMLCFARIKHNGKYVIVPGTSLAAAQNNALDLIKQVL